MMSEATATPVYPSTWKRPPYIKSSRLRWTLFLGAGIYLAAAVGTMEVNWQRVAEGLPRGERFLAAFFPPNFADNRGVVWDGIKESIWMAIIAT